MNLPGEYFTLTIKPHDWRNCFSDTMFRDRKELHQLVFHTIRIEEDRLNMGKEHTGASYPSLDYLKGQDMRRAYSPKKFGKSMLCLASGKLTLILYLKWLKETYRQLPRILCSRWVLVCKSATNAYSNCLSLVRREGLSVR